jgi:UDP-3-O-[3-hydroxymyristoyl] N-acetylglucosamine deacetylase
MVPGVFSLTEGAPGETVAFQHTIAGPVEFSGIGLHSAVPGRMRLLPASANRGIVFRRTDLDDFEVPASWKHIARVSYATSLMRKSVLISTTEHVLSALVGLEIDNVIIEIDALEVPILDGSSQPFVELLRKVGRKRQRAARMCLRIRESIEIVDGPKRIAVFPDTRFRITSHVNFRHPLVGHQSLDIEISPESYAREIAPARTFGFVDQLPKMKEMGLIRGGSLANAVVFDSTAVMNPEGLRYEDECCRHKILDLMGDLALMGRPLLGHVVAEQAGHAMHTALVLRLMQDETLCETVNTEEVSGAQIGGEEMGVAVGSGAE